VTDFLNGLAPDHRPALVAVLLLAPAAWYVGRARWAAALRAQWTAAPATVRWAAALLLVTAAVHLALPLADHGPLLTIAFLGSAVAYVAMAARAIDGRRWRALTALLMLATLTAYLVVVGRGEEVDQVGLATAVDELVVLGLCLVPPRGLRRPVRRAFASVGFVLAIVVSGGVAWAVSVAQHDDHGATHLASGHDHGDHLARAQAGIILRPVGPPPTDAQRRAAADLAERTTWAVQRYRDYRVALADGYRVAGPLRGLAVHFSSKARGDDGRVLDPDAPETLVYAAGNGRILLLGVMYQMPRAGVPGPAVGGSATRWHTHNVCFTLLPPGFGVVSPYGTCPFTSYTVTPGEMMHVWTVDPPGGPYVEHPDDAWVRAKLATEGLPV
jgi:hypothetical protein